MALDPLATTADLTARGIDATNEARALAALAAASDAVRDAARCPITRVASTIAIPGVPDEWLTLPAGPVRSVTAVAIDGAAVTDYRLVGVQLWRYGGWLGGLYPYTDLTRVAAYAGGGLPAPPTQVTVTYDHGLEQCPADIIDLVCSLAAASLAAAYGDHNVIQERERIDDYDRSVTYRSDVVSPVTLPEASRDWLRQRFNGSAYVVGMQR